MIIENDEDKEALISGLSIFKSRTSSEFNILDILKQNEMMYCEDDALDQDINAIENRTDITKQKPNTLSFSVNGRSITIHKTDRKRAEKNTGADLIYHATTDKKYLLIQHKIIENETKSVLLDEQLGKQFERLFRWCGKSEIGMGSFTFKCSKNLIDNLSEEQLSIAAKRLRLIGYCPAYLKICLRDKSRELDSKYFSSGVILPACMAYVILKNNGHIKPIDKQKMMRHSELENLFANCLIGRDDENLSRHASTIDRPVRFFATETMDEQSIPTNEKETP